MGRPAGAVNQPDKAAVKILRNATFLKKLKQFDTDQLEVLNDMARGRIPGRNANAMLGAIRTKLEWGHAKPAQEHELSGSVTITVESPLVGSPGSGRAKALPVATHNVIEAIESSPLRANLPQRPITANMSTSESGEIPRDYTTNDPEPLIDPDEPTDPECELLRSPSVIEAGKLVATEDMGLTPEQRRERARAEWLADQAVHGTVAGRGDDGETP